MTASSSREALAAFVREIAASGVEFDDGRVGYVTVQIDCNTWAEIGRAADELEAKDAVASATSISQPVSQDRAERSEGEGAGRAVADNAAQGNSSSGLRSPQSDGPSPVSERLEEIAAEIAQTNFNAPVSPVPPSPGVGLDHEWSPVSCAPLNAWLEQLEKDNGKKTQAFFIVWDDGKVSWNWAESLVRNAALAAIIENAQRLRASHPTEKEKL